MPSVGPLQQPGMPRVNSHLDLDALRERALLKHGGLLRPFGDVGRPAPRRHLRSSPFPAPSGRASLRCWLQERQRKQGKSNLMQPISQAFKRLDSLQKAARGGARFLASQLLG